MTKPPAPLASLLRLLPDRLHGQSLALLCNHLMKGQYLAGQLQELDGKRLCLHIRDTGNELVFAVSGGRLVRQPAKAAWDVRIGGRLEDFWLLATRQEDPDTLFFSRSLTIEGDTETGLYVKNFLDALEFDLDAHMMEVLGPRVSARAQKLARLTGVEQRLKHLLGQSQR